MKMIIAFAFGMFLFTSCDIYVPEEVVYYHDHRADVTGEYEMVEYSETYRDHTSYSVMITSAWGRDEITIYNFYDLGCNVTAYVDGKSITIPHQVVEGYEIVGHGRIQYDELELTYSVTDRYHDTPTDFCFADAYRLQDY